jgi:hypothetical protein
MTNELIKIKRAAQVVGLAAANLSSEIEDLLKTAGVTEASVANPYLTPKIVEMVKAHSGIKRGDLIGMVMRECGIPQGDAYTKINGAVRAKKLSYHRKSDSVFPYDESIVDRQLQGSRLRTSDIVGIVVNQPGIKKRDLVARLVDTFLVSQPTAYRQIDAAIATKKIAFRAEGDTLFPYREDMDAAMLAITPKANRFTTEMIVDVVANQPGIARSRIIRMMTDNSGITPRAAYDKLYCAIRTGKIKPRVDGKSVVLYVEASQ